MFIINYKTYNFIVESINCDFECVVNFKLNCISHHWRFVF